MNDPRIKYQAHRRLIRIRRPVDKLFDFYYSNQTGNIKTISIALNNGYIMSSNVAEYVVSFKYHHMSNNSVGIQGEYTDYVFYAYKTAYICFFEFVNLTTNQLLDTSHKYSLRTYINPNNPNI